MNHFQNIHKKNILLWVRRADFITTASWLPWVMCHVCSHYLQLYNVLELWAFSFLTFSFADLHIFLPLTWSCTLAPFSIFLTPHLPLPIFHCFSWFCCASSLPCALAQLYFGRCGVLLLLLGFLPVERMSTNKLQIFLLYYCFFPPTFSTKYSWSICLPSCNFWQVGLPSCDFILFSSFTLK